MPYRVTSLSHANHAKLTSSVTETQRFRDMRNEGVNLISRIFECGIRVFGTGNCNMAHSTPLEKVLQQTVTQRVAEFL
jgi:hypothetical protein